MEKYETPIMEVIDFDKTKDIVTASVDDVIDKDDENKEMIGPF